MFWRKRYILQNVFVMCAFFFYNECIKSRLYFIFPAFRRLACADSMHVYQYTLAFEPDFLLEQRSTLNSGCPSWRIPAVFLYSFKLQTFCSKARNNTTTLRRLEWTDSSFY